MFKIRPQFVLYILANEPVTESVGNISAVNFAKLRYF